MRGLRKDGRGHGADLVIRQGTFRAQHRGTGSETGCELHSLSPDKGFAVQTAHRIPRFGARLSAFRWGRRGDLGRPRCHRLS
ncbi:hypothetical protein CSC31_2359 [Pseudomonas aeruginosa]|nr:hypothetical protein CSB97_1420 [Pseudomonas aeruginosa]AWE80037.1 hypothetical protein CSC31_2359 [Pseudomonas aeruginosa]